MTRSGAMPNENPALDDAEAADAAPAPANADPAAPAVLKSTVKRRDPVQGGWWVEEDGVLS